MLQVWDLSINTLNSTLSPFNNMQLLRILNVSGNAFSGSLPAQWSAFINLASLSASRCPSLTGSIPSEWGSPGHLTKLSVSPSLGTTTTT